MTTNAGNAQGPHWPGAQRAYRGRDMDQPSNAEIMRRVDDLQSAIREDFAEIRSAHERFVLREVYEAKHTALTAQVEAVRVQQEKDNAERRTDRRWAIGSIVIPLVIFAYQIISNLQGAAS